MYQRATSAHTGHFEDVDAVCSEEKKKTPENVLFKLVKSTTNNPPTEKGVWTRGLTMTFSI